MLKFSKRWCDFPVVSSISMRNSGSSMLVMASSRAFITSKAWFSRDWFVPRSALSTVRNCSNIAITSARVSNILYTPLEHSSTSNEDYHWTAENSSGYACLTNREKTVRHFNLAFQTFIDWVKHTIQSRDVHGFICCDPKNPIRQISDQTQPDQKTYDDAKGWMFKIHFIE